MTRSIDVCLSPDLMHLYQVCDQTVVVVDILRATSCMTTAFAHGIKSITPFADLQDCLSLKSKGYFTAGERDGKKVDGFDLGNSPFEYMHSHLRGQKIAFTTTNGSRAIIKSAGARDIIIGSFLNLSAVVTFLRKVPNNILIVCSGWKGKINLEDTLYAGGLVENLKNEFCHACDAPIIAQNLYRSGRDNLREFLKDSSHVRRLHNLNIHKDIDFCLTEDRYDVVPFIKDNVLMIATP
jgi:2-phosphosulfolactate phosphatase